MPDVSRRPEHPEKGLYKISASERAQEFLDGDFFSCVMNATLSRESYAVRVQKRVLTHEKHRKYINVQTRCKNAAERKTRRIFEHPNRTKQDLTGIIAESVSNTHVYGRVLQIQERC